MSKTTFPYVTGASILRTCRRCRSRVALPAMCVEHTRTCLTCCGRLERRCVLEPIEVQAANALGAHGHSADATTMTWEGRQADMAKLNHELGFPDYTPEQLADDLKWRAKDS